MTKEEIRNRVVEMASGSKGIIVSIPEALAMVGGEMSTHFCPVGDIYIFY